MDYVLLAEGIAKKAHEGQLDKGGNPYILHPTTVSSLVESPLEKTVAWLHDVVEDTAWTLDGLREQGFPEEVIQAVDAITRRPGEDKDAYYQRVVQNPIAIRVKRADLTHNSDITRIPQPTEKDYMRLMEYQRRIAQLDECLRQE